MKNKFSIALSVAVILAMVFTSLALADQVGVDNDTVSPGNQSSVNLTVSPGDTVTESAQLVVDFQGSSHLVAGSDLVLKVGTNNLPAGYTVSDVTTTVPDPWNNTVNLFVAGTSTISFVAPSTPDTYVYTVKWDDKTKSCTGVQDCVSSGNAFTINLTVVAASKTDATINITPYSVTYDGNSHTATGTATGANGEDLSGLLDLSGTTHTDAGTYNNDTWSFAGNDSYNSASGIITDTIAKASSSVTVTCPTSAVYNGLAQEVCSASYSTSDGLSGSLTVTYSGNTNAGTATASASYAGDSNHDASSNSTTFEIEKANAACTVTGYSVTYDGSAHAATGSCTGVQNESLSGLDLNGTTHTNAGFYTDPWTFTDVTGNYNDITDGTVTDIIDKADAICTVTGYSVIYDGLAHTAIGSCTGVLDEGLSGLDLSGTTHTAAGDYPSDPWSFTDVTGNYNDISGRTVHDNIHFALCVLYDQSKSHKSGSTVPLKLQLCGANGTNYSSSSIVVHATSLSHVDITPSPLVDDSGAANSPDMNFRYDSTLGGTGGYIFNLSTKGLSNGIWTVAFTVDNVSDPSYVVTFGIK